MSGGGGVGGGGGGMVIQSFYDKQNKVGLKISTFF